MTIPQNKWTFVYLGGDSYPACTHAEEALRQRLMRPGDHFIGQQEFMAYHEDGVWIRDIALRMAGLRQLLAQRGGAPERIVLIGRSAGARVATRLAASPGGMNSVAAVLCLAYPFHRPDGTEELERTRHLAMLRVPTLILQGREDAWGGPDVAERYRLSSAIRLRFLACDHDTRLSPAAWDAAAGEVEAFLGRDATALAA
jgi:predicted alpha/beta-hydrolase family hydrolase